MHITLNGEERELLDGMSVAELVTTISARTSGLAVAVNSEVVPRSGWSDTSVADGDRVEVVTAVQGG